MHDDTPFVAARSDGFISGATGIEAGYKLPTIELRRTWTLGMMEGRKSSGIYSPDMDEHCHQVLLVRWAEAMTQLRHALRMLVAIPNAGKRSRLAGSRLKAEGMKPGYPDLALNVPAWGYGGLFIELKTPTGRASPEQKRWLQDLSDEGNLAAICKGWVPATDLILGYLNGDYKAMT